MISFQSNISGARLPTRVAGILGRLLTLLAGALLLIVGVSFSLLTLSIVVVSSLIVFAYLKWKAHALARDFPKRFRRTGARCAEVPTDGRVIEGELIGAEYERRDADAHSRSLRAP